MKAPQFVNASDSSLLVKFGEGEISLENHRSVVELVARLDSSKTLNLENVQPGYSSVLLTFHPLEQTHESLQHTILELAGKSPIPEDLALSGNTVTIPVCYDREVAPDLDFVAAHSGLSVEEVIKLHSGASYKVYFLGFMPGFAYLGGMPPKLSTPRLSSPRLKVPRGTVGIAGGQTGVYPLETPGGWRLIGRTPVELFDPRRHPLSLLNMGDDVKFTPITLEEFRRFQK